ncbi:GNAT family N-acetyltransferase [Pseudoalteromonas luteoviolacea]|uniref:N-acetyltransferase domain-containing protein n=1 Tax=Pseudoalteromonas luteoviolacea S4054 TaxID=1129367 RepID=A0A0F6ADX3_9GAMM|nr:GNAT family N-acetyltransferase [Pseudoalteromonas luteoviolacea]AOT08836.1 hypothetical protein S4054249_13660 [Pseudoalteromonas luteoviolacea]AOT13749.1 hypothetical protein S40542_13630 [Pseudoalteromonas luteoviolacea]AOT18663.1 hypothetical protein S4054_13635 [Pseudoalteromonas luteoviolacea]KKE83599.1 hypothetical protein N479_13140 [Pseudoalteromonas luteoviolacea S4054]KZN72788.1 hypothetical protein N481_14275 [Pseudoalteromonas luteoviolacea S4047-1]
MNKNVVLRPLEPTDGIDLVKHLNNPNVIRYLSDRLPKPYTLQDAKWWLEIGQRQNALNYAIECNGQFCGVIGAYLPDDLSSQQDAELGYWLGEYFWGNGIGTHAVALFIEKFFEKTSLKALYNPISSPNQASIRVMEKVGFRLKYITQKTAFHQGEACDEHVYVLKRADIR